MSNDSNPKPQERKTQRQLQRDMLERMGQKTPEQQVMDFQRVYLANWMKKQSGGG